MTLALVSSKGGHRGQMKLLFDRRTLGSVRAILVTESERKQKVEARSFLNQHPTYFFRKDHLGFNHFRYWIAIMNLLRIFKKERVTLLITNGAQLSIAAVIAAKIMGIKTVFIDTVIRVKTPNWSARACYPFSDIFLVQHSSMVAKYGKRARFVGGIV